MPNTFIKFPDPYYKERSSIAVLVNFRDSSDAAAAPTTIHYRIDNLSTGDNLLDWTTVSPASSATITIKASENIIKNEGNRRERYQITVAADKDTDDETRDTAFWVCENIEGFDN